MAVGLETPDRRQSLLGQAGKADAMPWFRCAALLVAAALPLSVAGAQERAPRPPENVKILTDLDGEALRAEMRRMSEALGVKCDHCHVQGNFASDERRPKRLARWMLEMTKALNAQQFPKYERKDGDSVLGRVTCYTCHQGAIEPRTAPPG